MNAINTTVEERFPLKSVRVRSKLRIQTFVATGYSVSNAGVLSVWRDEALGEMAFRRIFLHSFAPGFWLEVEE